MTARAKPAGTMRLDEIAEAWRAYDRAMFASGGEVTEETDAELARLDLAERDKVDGYALRIRALQGQLQAYEALAREIKQKAERVFVEKNRMMARVAEFMAGRQVDVVSGEIFRFQWEGNGGLVPVELVVDPSHPAFPDRFLKPPPSPPPVVVDTDALRLALKLDDPDALTVARLVPGRHLQIR